MKTLILRGAIISSLFFTSFAYAKNQKHKEGSSQAETYHSKSGSQSHNDPWLKFAFSFEEKKAIRHYVEECERESKGKKNGKQLPPGLQKKLDRGGSLPPGWQKKLAKGEAITEEVYRHCHPLPAEILQKLPRPPKGTILVSIEGRIVRLMEATRTILDVFDVTI